MGTQQSTSRHRQTRAHNAEMTIDFAQHKTIADFARPNQRVSVWADKLRHIRESVLDGQAKPREFYKIGEFTNPSGARTAIRNILRRTELLPPATFSMQSQATTLPDGTRGSELWAAVMEAAPPHPRAATEQQDVQLTLS